MDGEWKLIMAKDNTIAIAHGNAEFDALYQNLRVAGDKFTFTYGDDYEGTITFKQGDKIQVNTIRKTNKDFTYVLNPQQFHVIGYLSTAVRYTIQGNHLNLFDHHNQLKQQFERV